MKTTKLTSNLITVFLILLPLVYLAMIWGGLPAEVPLHFGIDGEADDWGSKNTLIYIPGLLTLGIYLLMRIIPAIDPKKAIQKMGNKYNAIMMVMVGFMSGLSLFILYVIQGNGSDLMPMMPALIGLLFIILGNYMQSIKPNYFLGIRTPWTLESDVVWQKTHRLGGRLFMIGGILIAIIALTMTGKAMFVTFFSILVIISIIPMVHSYLEFQKIKRLKE